MTDEEPRRHSVSAEPDIADDPQSIAEIEARNGLLQFDLLDSMVTEALERGDFRLRVSTILSLHRAALQGLSQFAGGFRPGGVAITESRHTPPEPHLVAGLLEEMCDHVNEQLRSASAIHVSAYIMWRLNWIHPFADGDGRTSRAVSYLVLCIMAGSLLPGRPKIPDQIVDNRNPYFEALDEADAAWGVGVIDVLGMEELLSGMLARQLRNAYDQMGGQA